jgi:hypothetical protein
MEDECNPVPSCNAGTTMNDESDGAYCNDSRRLMINPPMRISKLRRCWRRRLPTVHAD